MTNEEINTLSDSDLESKIHSLIFPKGDKVANFYHTQKPAKYCSDWGVLMPLVIKYASAVWIDTDNEKTEADLDWWGGKDFLGDQVRSSVSASSESSQRALAECLLAVLINEETK